MTELHVPSATTALVTMARLTLVRLSRGKLMWISMAIGLLPILYATAGFDSKDPVGGVFVIEMVVLSVMAPLFVSPSIGEEIEDRTATYLWSRPLPRWTILAGKLCALAPITMAITVASWVGAILVKTHELPPVSTIVGLAGGALAISAISAAIAVLVPKQGMALAIIYMIVDQIVGNFPGSIRLLSVTHAATAIGGIDETPALTGAVAMTVIASLWFAVAFRRIGRLET